MKITPRNQWLKTTNEDIEIARRMHEIVETLKTALDTMPSEFKYSAINIICQELIAWGAIGLRNGDFISGATKNSKIKYEQNLDLYERYKEMYGLDDLDELYEDEDK